MLAEFNDGKFDELKVLGCGCRFMDIQSYLAISTETAIKPG